MMKLYHGTTKDFTDNIIAKTEIIDVSIGKGELGKGFYTAKDIGLVSIWAKARHKDKSSIIEFSIDEFEYASLEIVSIKLKAEVREIYENNKNKIFNVDVVEGPFMSMDSRIQYKFESRKAEILLNKSISRIK